jgi:hypothetical protein
MKILTLLFLLFFFLSSCSINIPPQGLGPDAEIVSQALNLQLTQIESKLSQKLKLPIPEFSVSNIKIKSTTPTYLADLATYHLKGSYNLKLKQARKIVIQKNNFFDLFVQRQTEGKTWRLLQNDGKQWSSYLIERTKKS